jgi:hypothetical protein
MQLNFSISSKTNLNLRHRPLERSRIESDGDQNQSLTFSCGEAKQRIAQTRALLAVTIYIYAARKRISQTTLGARLREVCRAGAWVEP